jgi:regulator of replication initiation timing
LDIADRKSQVQEAAVKRLNQERESAISQLGVAYLETRELKAENDQLREENANLRSQLARVAAKARDQKTQETDSSMSASDPDDSNAYSADMSRSTRELASKSSRDKLKSKRQDDSRAKISTQVDKEISRLEKERAEEALFSIEMPTTKRTSASKSVKTGYSESRGSRKQPNTSKQRVKRVVVEDISSAVESTEQTKASSDVEDLTLLSVIDVSCGIFSVLILHNANH